MPHLAIPRKGWENENLASYILSRFSFIARPLTVSDDVGLDFYCTLLDKTGKYLFPRNAFWIQIKSSKNSFNVTKNSDYLERIELPIFIGVINRRNLKLTIYSGEYIPLFFVYKGEYNLRLKPHNGFPKTLNGFYSKRGNKYTVLLPKILDIEANISDEKLKHITKKLFQTCSRMQKNIATKMMGEHLYSTYNKKVIFAGQGSAKVFRNNFYSRLAELFANYKWLLENKHSKKIIREASFYLEFYNKLESRSPKQLPIILKNTYSNLKKSVKTATDT